MTHIQQEVEEEGKWEDLTDDLLAQILNRLNTKADLCRFRSICKSWRSFATLNQPHPLFPVIVPPLNPNSRSFTLSPALLYIFSPNFTLQDNDSNVWLTKVVETGDSNKWALLNPLTKHKLYAFSSGVFKNGINLLDFRNHGVGRSYCHQLIGGRDEDDDHTFDFDEFTSITLKKFVVLINERISVLGLYGFGEIALWNYGDEKWNIIETGKKGKKNDFNDVISFNGKFYAVDQSGALVMINPTADMELVEVINSTDECMGSLDFFNGHEIHTTYLVESDFRLYMVNKFVSARPTNYYDDDEDEWLVDKTNVGKPLRFKVHVLNEKGKCWESVKSLGNKVFFVSRDAAFSVNAEDLGWNKGNCIYFEGLTGYDDEADMCFGLNAGVYTLEDEAFVTFGSTVDRWTRIFWPPSSWFVQHEEYPECEMLED